MLGARCACHVAVDASGMTRGMVIASEECRAREQGKSGNNTESDSAELRSTRGAKVRRRGRCSRSPWKASHPNGSHQS